MQPTEHNPTDIKSVTIFSEIDNVVVDFPNPSKRKSGLVLVADRKVYQDTGIMNRLIDSIYSKMLIRITTTDNQVYDFYPSNEFISYAKKVAKWS